MSSPCSTFRVFRGKNRNNKQNTPNLSPLRRSEKQETNYAHTIGQPALKHNGRLFSSWEAHLGDGLMVILDWRAKTATATCKLTVILLTQVIRCQQASPKWKPSSKNGFCSMASQSRLVWLSKMGTALVCGLPQLKVWLQGGTSIIPLRARCHRLISCRTFERHFHVSNYHYGAKATPAALQHGVLASPWTIRS